MRHVVLILAFLLVGYGAHAQVGVYAMASAGHLSGYRQYVSYPTTPDNSFWAGGGTFGVYDDFLRLGPLKLGGDVRGFVQNSSHSPYKNQLRGGLVGLRLALHAPVIPFKPYIQAEIGGAGSNFGYSSSRSTYFAYQVQVGADFTIFPHVDLRGEYGGGQMHSVFGSRDLPMQQLGGGVVVRF